MHLLGLSIVIASLIFMVAFPGARELVVTCFGLAPEITVLTFLGFLYPISLYLYALFKKKPVFSRVFFNSQVALGSSLCVSLGLLATFIGQAQMVTYLAAGMNAKGDFSTRISALLDSIGQSLDAMALTFVTSVLGVGASTVLLVACNYISTYFPDEASEKKSTDDDSSTAVGNSKQPPFDAELLAEKLANAITRSINFNQIGVLAGAIKESNKIQKEMSESLLRIENIGAHTGVGGGASAGNSGQLTEYFSFQDSINSKTVEMLAKMDSNYRDSIQNFGDGLKSISSFSNRLMDELGVISNSMNRITEAVEVQENSSLELREFIQDLVKKQNISISDLAALLADLKYLLLPPLEEDLKASIENDLLNIRFQPQYNIKDEIHGFEVLLYWNHPVRGEVMNCEIFESKIKNNFELLKKLDQWIISKAFQKLSGWIRSNAWNPDWIISLNISPAYAEDLSLLTFLRSMAEKYKIPAHYVAIEIKEDSFVSHPEIVQQQVCGIQEIGMEVYVDHYGMEGASLIKFRRMGITRLKVDKLTTQCLVDELDAPSELRAILASANQLTFEIIASGVEGEAQYIHLKKVGFDLFQGNYFSKPINDISELPFL